MNRLTEPKNRLTDAKADASAMKPMKAVTRVSVSELCPIPIPPDPFGATTREGWSPWMVSTNHD